MSRLQLFACALALAGVASCSSTSDGEDAEDSESAEGAALTVQNAAAKSCSTDVVRGLADQLVQEIACIEPTLLTTFDDAESITLDPEVFPHLQPNAAAALKAAAKAYGKPLNINSALRTLPQQYLLRRWDAKNRCGVRVAAAVGTSNHESGLAVDVDITGGAAANKAIRAALTAQGFVWLGSGDPMHYDYKGEGDRDVVGTSVRAFKRLWNRNHPEARLDEDEKYDSLTEAKLKSSPAGGFAIGAVCDPE